MNALREPLMLPRWCMGGGSLSRENAPAFAHGVCETSLTKNADDNTEVFEFCPYCGARMEGGVE